MKADLWDQRAASLAQYNGQGMTFSEIANQESLCVSTVRRYAEKFGLDFGASTSGRQAVERVCRLQEYAEQGMTVEEAAAASGISKKTAGDIGRANGIKFRHGSCGRGVDFERSEVMASMYRSGKTLAEIGEVYGLSRERVRQVIKKRAGITSADGGQAISSRRTRERKQSKRDRDCLEKHGCLYDQYRELLSIGKRKVADGESPHRRPTIAFLSQRQNAKTRGIDWNLKLWEWWRIWQDSGKWEQRGLGRDLYVMCRFGDTGPYEAGNVYIATLAHNSTVQPNNPYRKSHPRHSEVVNPTSRQKAAGQTRRKYTHLPAGVTIHKKSTRFLAQASVDGKNRYLGTFDTPELAHAAYLSAVGTPSNEKREERAAS